MVLGLVGVRVLRSLSEAQQQRGAARRERSGLVVAGGLAQRLAGEVAFGWLLIGFAAYFVACQLLAA